MSEHEFDLVVLGGGSGGYAAALRARELGSTVALIEKDKVGGTCLHRGCVPTKALLHTAEIADEVRGSAAYGIQSTLQGVDIDAVGRFREGIVSAKFKGLQGLLKARGIEVVAGAGRLTSPTTVEVAGEVYRGRNVVLATGSYSKTLPGLEIGGRIITSEQALTLDEVPGRVIVLGGGVIGVEFASVWASWGAQVSIVEGFPHLVAKEEEHISRQLEREYRKRGIDLHLGVRFKSATDTGAGVSVELEDGTTLSADYLLVAIGRGPVTQNLGYEEVGVAMERGFVTVDERLRTSVPGVYAVGDIVPGLQLAHRAYQQGIFVAEEIAGLDPVVIDDLNVPRVTYCEPQIFSIGLTEAQARERFGEDGVQAYEYNLAGNAKSSILGTSGFIKMVRRVDGPIVGVHGIGARVGELVGEAQLIVNWEAYPEDIAPLIHAHPTQTETIGEAALYLAGKPLHAI
ncbi:dihydrolipoyl dehydrogenase [Pseudoclavibacter caeni]|uniref:Dihydrolipoyl dehydrogenase n=1 Tax=Pseudoclavibacter caeni TaxID=908846 RepID=A0A7C8FIX9_9MICO|nr:dihydrolipoyl dehydrogenase [Pseudoclavibacter caeni]KAB1632806.1 dihydrolipoyl dehydrogenase [Pseudoclavibacter caeni]NYJ97241.1 dihydrolipoamide dehydrogenase [Pseudoclavibacter caeni]